LKICVVSPGYPGNVNPWNGILIKEDARNISRTGCDVSVVTSKVFSEDPSFFLDGDVKVNRFWFPSERKLLAEYDNIPVFRVGVYLLSGILRTVRVVRREKSDVIHAHWAIPAGFIATVAGRLTRKPVVLTVHDADITTFPDKSKIAGKCITYALNHAAVIICVNHFLEDRVKNYFHIDPAKVRFIPLGINKDLFQRIDKAEARRKLKLPADKTLILYLGSMLEIKGVRHLTEAIPKVAAGHDNVLFLMAGHGPLEGEVKARLKELNVGESVRLVGSIPHDDIPVWMSAADVLVIPSLSEGRPRVGLEALSIGLPIVGSRVGAIPEIIKDGENGLIVESGSGDSLAAAFNSILDDKELYERLRAGAKLLPEFDATVAAGRVVKVYEEVTKR